MLIKQKVQATLRFRLLLFFISLIVIVLLGLFIMLLFTDNISVGLKESEEVLLNEHTNQYAKLNDMLQSLAAESVAFSKLIALNVEAKLYEKKLNINDMKNNPSLIEEILSNELNQLLMYLNKSKSSGAFIILDATINNRLPNSDYSKAGIYLKNMEPNIVNSSSPTIYMLRGSAKIAYSNSISLHPEWKMEFNIKNQDYFYKAFYNANNSNEQLSNLYLWTPSVTLTDANEELLICSVPLIDSKGNTFGICGLDISAMLFKLAFMPSNNMYHRTICMLSLIQDNTINVKRSFLSGGYDARSSLSNDNLTILKTNNNLLKYENYESSFMGYHEEIKLYPEKSSFSNEEWLFAVLVPKEDIRSYVVSSNLKLFYILISFLILSIIAASVLSKYYIRPINKAIKNLKDDPCAKAKTNIFEIDELLECVSLKLENLLKEKDSVPNSDILKEFLANLKTLSPAERCVFNLYAENLTAKEIAEKLFLSINTIKTHTKHIYSKLYINSKEELLLYVEMLKETGRL